jgi:capsular exopolysaccharide synthesis family protein
MLDIGGQKVGPADLIIHKPVIPFGEAFRVARNTLRLGGGGRKVLTMVSSLPNEGKTTSVVSMARIMAQAGDRVLLIDGDIRKASLTAMTVGEREKGLIELLHGDATLDEVLVKDSVGGLDIIPLAKPLFTAEDVFGSDAMKALIETNRDRYDQILIDTPPLLGVADARTLASLSDAVVLLIRWGSTPLNSIRSGLTWLEMDRAPVAGAMFTMVDPRSEAIGAMYYSRKYSSYYQSA